MKDKLQEMTERSSLQYSLNDSICSGISTKEVGSSMKFLNNIFESAFRNRVKGLVYKGLERLTPEATVGLMGPGSVFKGYDITSSMIYAVKVSWDYYPTEDAKKPVKLHRSFFMPYVDSNGLIYISGGLYNLRPILFDKCLSPSAHNVFIRLYRDKSTTHRINYRVVHNKTTIQGNVIYIKPNVKGYKPKLMNRPHPGIFLYLFVKFGYTEAMRHILGYVPEVILNQGPHNEDPDYLYYYSHEMRGENQKYRTKLGAYTATRIALRVKKSEVQDKKKLESAIVNAMYAFDHGNTIMPDDIDNIQVWKVVLSQILLGQLNIPIQDMLSKLELHLTTLDELVDLFMVTRFRLEFRDSLDTYGNVEEYGFYAILMIIYHNFDKWVRSSTGITASIYDKRVETLYGLHYATIVVINKLATTLCSVKYGVTGSLQRKINKNLTSGHVFGIRKPDSTLVALDSVTITSDNKLHGLTTSVGLQLNLKSSGSKNSKSNGSIADSSTLLGSTHSIGGTITGLSKAKVSPLQTLNIFANYNNGTIVPVKSLIRSTENLTNIVAKNPRNTSIPAIPEEFLLTMNDMVDDF